MKPKRLKQDFFNRSARIVAKDLIGCIFAIERGRKLYRVRIVETEAYLGEEDLACHASKGCTPRTKVMFGPPGYAYIYLIYGIHQMLNVVCEEEGTPHAVLIRAAEALSPPQLKLSGPGRLTKGLSIGKDDNGISLFSDRAYFEESSPPKRIQKSPRIGVDYAKDWKDKALRFYDPTSSAVSKPR